MKLSSLFRIALLFGTFIQLLSLLTEHYVLERSNAQAGQHIAQEQVALAFERHAPSLKAQLLVGNIEYAKREIEESSFRKELEMTLYPAGIIIPPAIPEKDPRVFIRDYELTSYGKNLGMIRFTKTIPSLYGRVKNLALIFLVGKLILIVAILGVFILALEKWILRPIEETIAQERGEKIASKGFVPSEIRLLQQKIADTVTEKEDLARERAQRLFAKQLVHDMRSPLAALRHWLGQKNNLQELEQTARSCLDRLETMTQNILEDAGLSQEKREIHDVATIFEESIKEISLAHPHRSQDLELQLFCRPISSIIDGKGLNRALINLVNNALLASETGQKILISLDLKQELIVVTITDEGKGLTPQEIEQTFEQGQSLRDGGYGVGLTQVKAFLNDHNGKWSVHSKKGKGTTVTLFIPQVTEKRFHYGDQIILVDDDPLVRRLWKIEAQNKGIPCQTLSSKKELMKVIKQVSKDSMICLDHDLGQGENGLDLGHELNQMGYYNSALVTAHDKESLPPIPEWIYFRGGKDFPLIQEAK